MKILPSWREGRRYLLIEIKNNKEKAKKDIAKALLNFLGILNYARARPFFVSLNNSQNLLVLSVNRKFLSHSRAALLLCKSKPKPRCIYVAGTLKKLKQRMKQMKNKQDGSTKNLKNKHNH
jgi:RNase P/RNase MRP subunit POP5